MSFGSHIFYAFQAWANRNHVRAFELLQKYIQWKPDDVILEVGCGAGNMASHFIEKNIPYIGIDLEPKRIAYAQSRFPQGVFLVADAREPLPANLPKPHHAFCHGLLHHLSNADVGVVLKQIAQKIGPQGRFAAVEDVRPASFFEGPLNYLFAKIDGGQFIRTRPEWQKLFGKSLQAVEFIGLPWPVPKLAFHLDIHTLDIS